MQLEAAKLLANYKSFIAPDSYQGSGDIKENHSPSDMAGLLED